MNWYQLDIEEICKLFGADLQGYSSNEAAERLRQVGPNELLGSGRKSMVSILLKQFGDVLILILLAAAVVSGIMGNLTDTLVILIIIILTALLGFLQEYRTEKAISALKKIAIPQVRVMRDQKSGWVPASVLVPGDIIFLEAGNTVPADARLIESDDLKIEEAVLTGESHSVGKTADSLKGDDLPIGDRINMVFKGTFATYGRGSAMVVATGMQTEIGCIAALLQKNNGLTPLQEKMAWFGKRLSMLVLLLCGLFFIIGWLRGENMMKTTLTGIALAVAAIPEALPAVITVSLAVAANKMIRFNCLIRKLPAVETLGSVTYICTDKTGTLTKNKMHVESVFVNERTDKQSKLKLRQDEKQSNLLLLAFALNNDVVFDNSLPKGDSTEIALLEAAQEQNIQTDNWPRITEIPFDSERKLMTTFHKHNHCQPTKF